MPFLRDYRPEYPYSRYSSLYNPYYPNFNYNPYCCGSKFYNYINPGIYPYSADYYYRPNPYPYYLNPAFY